MFRASPWIPYDPSSHQHDNSKAFPLSPPRNSNSNNNNNNNLVAAAVTSTANYSMDAPEISTLREDDEDEMPPEGGRGFTKFRVSVRGGGWGQSMHRSSHVDSIRVGATGAGGGNNGGVGNSNSSQRRGAQTRGGPSGIDSDDDGGGGEEEEEEEEEDQLIDDEELIVPGSEFLRGSRSNVMSSPAPAPAPVNSTAAVPDTSILTPTSRRRGGSTRGRGRRGATTTGRRGRPGREPPDAAAMMSTFELGRSGDGTEDPPISRIEPPSLLPPLPRTPPPPTSSFNTPTPTTTTIVPSTKHQSSSHTAASSLLPSSVSVPESWPGQGPAATKPPRKKPGPKKGTTLGPRGPRKNASKTANNTPGTLTPLDDSGAIDASSFLIPAAPSIPATPKSEQNPLPGIPHQAHQPSQSSLANPYLPPITLPDFTADPTIPVPLWPLPTRAFPVQPPPKIPTGYAPTHPLDTKRPPARKWISMQREIKGIAGGRWFAKTWVSGAAPDVHETDISRSGTPPPPHLPPLTPSVTAAAGPSTKTSTSVPPESNKVPAASSLLDSHTMSTSAAAAALLEVSQREHERGREREREKELELKSERKSHPLPGATIMEVSSSSQHKRELSQLDHLAQAAASFSRLPEPGHDVAEVSSNEQQSTTQQLDVERPKKSSVDMEIDFDADIDVDMTSLA